MFSNNTSVWFPDNITSVLYILDGVYEEAGFPPTPVLWVTSILDTACTILPCGHWREFLVNDPDSWFSEKFRVPSAFEPGIFPDKLSYDAFLEQTGQTDEAFSPSTLYQYAFETSDTSLSVIATPASLIVIICLVLFIRVFKMIFMPIFSDWGRRAALSRHGAEWVADNEERLYKFGEYCYRLCFHTAMSTYGVYYFWDKEWTSWETKAYQQIGCPHHPMPPGFSWYYLIQFSYNVDAFLSLIAMSVDFKVRSLGGFQFPLTIGWSPTVRGDFAEMAIHHVATNGLIFYSSLFRVTRAGSCVLVLHDVSDVPIDISKLMHFLRYRTATILCFVTMVCVWVVTRMYLYPVFVIWNCFINAHELMIDYPQLLFLVSRHLVYMMMIVLAFLHCFWFTLFLKMFYKLGAKGETHDLSEHKQGEKQDTTKVTTTNRIAEKKAQ